LQPSLHIETLFAEAGLQRVELAPRKQTDAAVPLSFGMGIGLPFFVAERMPLTFQE